MFRRLPPLVALLLLGLLVTACGGIGSTDGKPQVVTSFYPLQFVTERIVGNHAHVTNLTSPGAEPHDLQLTVRQGVLVSNAELAVYEHGLQPSVDQVVTNDPPRHAVDVADVVRLSAVPPGLGDEHATDAKGNAVDPHFWLDPTLLGRVADRIAAVMARADPKHAADYRANNAALQSDLRSLDHDYRVGLEHCRSRTLVVSHDAWEYLGRRYHLRIYPIAGISPDAEPSPKHLSELSQLIRTDKITTVFTERLASPKLADALAGDLGIRTAVLDPIEGLSSADPQATYLSLMRENLAAIQKADSCS
ncbi:metal ABC transporter substrate-binding protein [Nocardioides terrisoli]|uniref:metal ABC transporter substrate-binding protein n=1 Tax=Nocardioides terrisoli TaxID=3388267 RepID=UPI00287B69BF|nr:metal ABC transporter substrate-binding protein [Nocardioides marmorisolisilvae]